jgi:hypothetical protein
VAVRWRWLLVCNTGIYGFFIFVGSFTIWYSGAENNVSFSATYDERSIRSHLRRVRELLSLSSLHVSLSTSLALQQESAQAKNAGTSDIPSLMLRFVDNAQS